MVVVIPYWNNSVSLGFELFFTLLHVYFYLFFLLIIFFDHFPRLFIEEILMFRLNLTLCLLHLQFSTQFLLYTHCVLLLQAYVRLIFPTYSSTFLLFSHGLRSSNWVFSPFLLQALVELLQLVLLELLLLLFLLVFLLLLVRALLLLFLLPGQ